MSCSALSYHLLRSDPLPLETAGRVGWKKEKEKEKREAGHDQQCDSLRYQPIQPIVSPHNIDLSLSLDRSLKKGLNRFTEAFGASFFLFRPNKSAEIVDRMIQKQDIGILVEKFIRFRELVYEVRSFDG